MDEAGRPKEFFSVTMPADLMRAMEAVANSKHIISALELLAVYVAMVVWRKELVHRRCFLAVDNEAARAALVKASSAAPCLRSICGLIAENDLQSPTFRWMVRVPSSSNSADGPSRGDCRRLLSADAVERTVAWQDLRIERIF